ncbi:hypothetical protein ETJ91_25820 [Bacillus albus]|uniref:hypothetical protein n=1 Tax=Bacillus albus TaxID=2026189 RepID=UPI001009EC9C|nr:hypothetical protein [Bacillus albus]RXJ13383.1 hypothetical protein ETJ91_25820 [Bacillus albus]RXJ22758.1 hypothetical protein ETJ90_27550 [Bacillus albus]RXJ24933.1 hypothetical protein ETJ76_25215 [Bacillus albus]RXJ36378.1 hypothetical protein ETJ89_25720 [Bacillus albus]RXJ52052.1 hypothetical protein ETJ66_26325 [Bacillus albus]
MEQLKPQFENGIKKYIPEYALVHNYKNKDFSILVANSILCSKKVAEDDEFSKHILLERFYLTDKLNRTMFKVSEIEPGYYTSEEGLPTILQNGINAFELVYGPKLNGHAISWRVEEDFVDVYLYLT